MAPLAGENAEPWITVAAAAELGAPRATLYRKVQLGKIPTRIREDGEREILVAALPPLVQQRYLELNAQARMAHGDAIAAELAKTEALSRLALHPIEIQEPLRREAIRRYELVLRAREIKPHIINGALRAEVAGLLARWPSPDPTLRLAKPKWAGRELSYRQLRRLADRVMKGGLAELIPGTPRVKSAEDRRLLRVDDKVRAFAAAIRLELPNATVQSLYRKTVKKFGGALVPRITTFRLLIRSEVPRAIEVLANEGPKTYRATVEAPIFRSREDLDIYALLCGDHHLFDVQVINPARGGHLDRPWLTMWLDEKSRAPAGWHMSFEANSSTIATALLDAMKEKEEPLRNLCGKPTWLYVDNGKDFRAQFFTLEQGLLTELGIGVTHAIPYNAKAKIVERAFGTIAVDFSRQMPGWCGSNPSEKTEKFDAQVREHNRRIDRGLPLVNTPFLTLDELRARFRAWLLEDYLCRPHAGLVERATGRTLTPLALIGERRSQPRMVQPETLALLMMKPVELTVQRSTVRWRREYYFSEKLEFRDGERVVCRVDDSDARRMQISSLKGEHICWATSRKLVASSPGAPLPVAAIEQAESKKRTLERAKKKIREIEEGALDTVEGALAASPPPPSAPPALTVARHPSSTIDLHPRADRRARDAAADQLRVLPVLPAAPMRVLPRDGEELSDEEWVTRELGEPRPVIKPWDDERTRRRLEEKTAVYDELALQLLATRHQPRSKQGGSPT